jgi:phosphodiesterase/alkaline phosphatase D-like protein
MKIIKSCLLLAIALSMCSASIAQTKDKDKDDQQRAQALKIINGPRVEGTGDSWAVIAWSTNTGGSTIIRYGTDKNNLNQTAEAPYADNESSRNQTHRVHLKNLKPNTTYYYMVDSGQGEGTGTEAKSPIAEFHTK